MNSQRLKEIKERCERANPENGWPCEDKTDARDQLLAADIPFLLGLVEEEQLITKALEKDLCLYKDMYAEMAKRVDALRASERSLKIQVAEARKEIERLRVIKIGEAKQTFTDAIGARGLTIGKGNR